MEESKFKKILSVIGSFLLIFTFVIPILPIGLMLGYQQLNITCISSPIPYTSTTEEDNTITSDQSYTKIEGMAGLKKVCTNGNHQITSNEIVTQPVNEILVSGTYFKPYIPPTYNDSYGSTCNDGTWTPSTGRGTCSWHGGVAY